MPSNSCFTSIIQAANKTEECILKARGSASNKWYNCQLPPQRFTSEKQVMQKVSLHFLFVFNFLATQFQKTNTNNSKCLLGVFCVSDEGLILGQCRVRSLQREGYPETRIFGSNVGYRVIPPKAYEAIIFGSCLQISSFKQILLSQRSMTKVHWPPVNKFVCKLHWYIVYFFSRWDSFSDFTVSWARCVICE